MSFAPHVQQAINLLRSHCPEEGYYVAFSGGKDSCAIKKLCQLAGIPFEAFYNNTTIDPPELIQFIRQHHADVKWNQPRHGAMMTRVANKPAMAPTRSVRWCCAEYKERGGDGRVKVVGVRQAESTRRRAWSEISEDGDGNKVVCPIVMWSDELLWDFLVSYNVPYCKLYDEGFERLGCVGCPLASKENQAREFERWPRFRANWEKAVKANWERYHGIPKRNGQPYYHARFKPAEDYWQWWLTAKAPDYIRGDCQSTNLMANPDVNDAVVEATN